MKNAKLDKILELLEELVKENKAHKAHRVISSPKVGSTAYRSEKKWIDVSEFFRQEFNDWKKIIQERSQYFDSRITPRQETFRTATYTETPNFFRVSLGGKHHSFVDKKDGAIYLASDASTPAPGVRGNIFDKKTRLACLTLDGLIIKRRRGRKKKSTSNQLPLV